MAKYGVNFTEGSVVKNHLRFALPLMATSVLQLMYNTADQIVVGRWTGSMALAAIGATSQLNLLLINVFMGVSMGAGVVMARKYGERDSIEMRKVAHSAIGVSFILGILAMIVGLVFCKPLLILTGTPADVMDMSVMYMRILFAGAPFVVVYNFGAAMLRSVGDTKRPLYILSATGVVNVGLNLLLVIVFHMSIEGVAIATITANFLSAVAVLYVLINSDAPYRISPRCIRIRKRDAIDFVKIGLPIGMQSIMYNLSNAVTQSAINTFGATVMASNTASSSVEAFIYVALNAFAQATLTSVSQNYGAKNKKRIYKTLWTGLALNTIFGVAICVTLATCSRWILGIYIADNPEAITIGISKMYITTLFYFLIGGQEQTGALLNGLGKSMYSTVNAFLGTCMLRVLWVIFVFPLNPTYTFLVWVYPISWIVTFVFNAIVFLFIKGNVFRKMEGQ